MIKKILIGLAIILLLFFAAAALQPGHFRVERSTSISATPATVFAHVNDLRKFQAWNPWGKIDPAMKSTHSGPPAGAGASYFWSGNNEVGEGRMTIVESRAPDLIRMKLEFLKPFAATNTAEFTLVPEGGRTRITWAMFGEQNYLAKVMSLVMSMDKMVGGSFEKGLADLKQLAEAEGAAKP